MAEQRRIVLKRDRKSETSRLAALTVQKIFEEEGWEDVQIERVELHGTPPAWGVTCSSSGPKKEMK